MKVPGTGSFMPTSPRTASGADRRGSACWISCRRSSASRSCLDSFDGTAIRRRASRSPLPVPFSLGAPRPLTRSVLPSVEPAGTLTRTVAPFGRRQLDLLAHRRLGEGHRHVDHEVVAAAGEERARGHPGDDVQVSGLTAARGRLALALDLDAGAVADARRDPHLIGLGRAHAARAVAGRARVLDHGAGAAAALARLVDREEALALGRDAAALAHGADRRRGARGGPRAVTGRAGVGLVDRHLARSRRAGRRRTTGSPAPRRRRRAAARRARRGRRG